jgi:hypothetical protein
LLTQLHSISRFISPQPISPAALEHIKHAQPISPADLLPCSTSSTHGSRNEMIEEKKKKKGKKSVKALKKELKNDRKTKKKKERKNERTNERTNEKKKACTAPLLVTVG